MKKRVLVCSASSTMELPPSSIISTKNCCWHIYVLVAVVAIACYVNGLSGDFVHDDIPAVTLNKDVLALSPIGHVFKNDFWGTPMADINSHKSYRPLTTLTFRSLTLCSPGFGWFRTPGSGLCGPHFSCNLSDPTVDTQRYGYGFVIMIPGWIRCSLSCSFPY